ncbi:MAG: hypothetical protein IPI07_05495 [Flavobacteriales bacterium]|nr:hypothetical protein [Flavobacteriales bacterium]
MPRELPQRASIRWQGYDYANVGAYYLTISTQDRLHLFGRIADGVMHPSPIGELAKRCWDAIPDHMPHVDVGEFVVMPNHVHGIVVIRERLVDARGVVRGRALDVGARHRYDRCARYDNRCARYDNGRARHWCDGCARQYRRCIGNNA